MSELQRRRPTGLGRGLSSLLGEVAQEAPVSGASPGGAVRMIAVADVQPNPDQPRRHFDEEALGELAASIRSRGVIQPIVVRPRGGAFQIVAGERRWRAAQNAGLHEVPTIVREFDDAEALEIALIENVQRRDLNAIEEAEAYQRLIDQFGHTQQELSRLVDKSRSHVANLLRLLDLPDGVRSALLSGELSMGHARAVASADDPARLAAEVIRRGLSVRDAEKLARGDRNQRRNRARTPAVADADIEALERQLGDILGLAVKISHRPDGGTVALSYSSLDQLDMICQRLSGDRI